MIAFSSKRCSSMAATMITLVSMRYPADAWTHGMLRAQTDHSIVASASTRTATSTQLYNIPPPSPDDVVAYKRYASKQSPPASFFELQQDCLTCTQIALDDGLLLMEIEFPPLPASVLNLDDVSAYDVAQANLRLATDFAKGLVVKGTVQNVAILFPDETEAKIAIEKVTGRRDNTQEPATVQVEPGVTVSSLRRSEKGDQRLIKVTFLHILPHCCAKAVS